MAERFSQLSQLVRWTELLNVCQQWTTGKRRHLAITMAIATVLLGRSIYNLTRPPKNLRHLPAIGFFPFFNNLAIKRLSTYRIFKTMTKPLLKDGNGIFVRCDRGGWQVCVANPVAAKTLYMKTDLFPKVDMSGFDGTLFNRYVRKSNILLANGAEWKKHRKLANPAFHRSLPVKMFSSHAEHMTCVLQNQQPQQEFTVDIVKLMECVTLDSIGQAAFGFDFGATEDPFSRWKVIYDKVMNDMRSPVFGLLPILERKFLWLFPGRQKAHKTLDEFMAMFEEIIDHKRKTLCENKDQGIAESEKDLLTLMLESELRGEGNLTMDEFMGDIAIFFVAGHDTTANALAYAVYQMSLHPDIQEKARAEVNNVLCPGGDIAEDITPTLEDIKKMDYLMCVIKETLRVNPSVISLVTPRITTEDVDLAGTFIPKNTKITVNIYELHHNPQVWKDADSFDPDRFLEGGEADKLAAQGIAWSPFANGARQCIGYNFSLVQQRVLLAHMLRRYEFSLPSDSPHRHELITNNSIITAPVNLKIIFKRRF
ncbi:cytochrome P-450 cyp509A1 [Hesseltinella vesiculosa]|uniref:Cytochrome P-450 cyp509A1 n=1 Tax=Hesseltinella vesiculosa TaxID=101127 RepID=A0A1X2GKB7_9FUNG|nr:cytochrome P-450 cyp509A1 [Hesseltinella vesiculosa]